MVAEISQEAARELLIEGVRARDLLWSIVDRWASEKNVETWSWFNEAKEQAQALDAAIRKATEVPNDQE